MEGAVAHGQPTSPLRQTLLFSKAALNSCIISRKTLQSDAIQAKIPMSRRAG
ncbi:hypothetical protein RMSM_06731 [Rhodopirellula maiorica SM1]|uniref:Uncharacterized protein n=1 Tax=Rhodopirellula maiorica SM1 TaxID=1265738 RepID=M5RLT1_9BACT|nr:hypothetical protein RMSM_06731 [Rhodopirellula maiorica SM1]